MESQRAKQLAFNGVWRGLKSQGFVASTNEEGDCMYRGDNRRKCAAGWLIRDENYSRRLEFYQASTDVIRDALRPTFEEFGESPPLSFIRNCQLVHDGSVGQPVPLPLQMEARLRELARDNGLTIPDEATS